MTTRTRFAPSPTGALHLGNARTAVLNWLIARHDAGAFVVRFEDTDIARNVDASEAEILESLDWLGLDRDEDPVVSGPYGPYRQSDRLEVYRARAEELRTRGLAYACYCTQEELDERRARAITAGQPAAYDGRCRNLTPEERQRLADEGRGSALRFCVEPGPIAYADRIRGEISVDGAEFGDIVILRSDGRPTYNFAVVVDDLAMRITTVIRGAAHLDNTPKQVLIYRAFDAEPPEFVHVPNVLAPGGGKLSKREGAPGLLEYGEAGYHPDAVVNYLSLLSWSSADAEEVFTPEELIERIDLDRLGSANPMIDLEKMRWLSGQHIRREPSATLATRIRPFISMVLLGLDDSDLGRLAEVLHQRILLFAEADVTARELYPEPELQSPEAATALADETAVPVLDQVSRAWGELAAWERAELKAGLASAGLAAGVRGKQLYHPVRVALTGAVQGPDLHDVAYAIGRDRTLGRLGVARDTARPS